ncbi:hypothetical protein BO85DRAFT_211758 [Aspergillus piperis CBS 112811]|uniref:Uncharacterized protein n=1 Tax=Aspergillus piperis CBS 112811 TaxID=1448313 RepID=A0A8G1VHA5_9EURO|nr:hypothetical protein BO85DRAFT_211758 [Aspergillus piperis CBS 112811]RAH52042.1 hypothetical protein BO85DRAFT_211758 [Aspergillus piperis CBS 112811]
MLFAFTGLGCVRIHDWDCLGCRTALPIAGYPNGPPGASEDAMWPVFPIPLEKCQKIN